MTSTVILSNPKGSNPGSLAPKNACIVNTTSLLVVLSPHLPISFIEGQMRMALDLIHVPRVQDDHGSVREHYLKGSPALTQCQRLEHIEHDHMLIPD